MIVGVPKELYPGEDRVAMIPNVVGTMKKKGFDVVIEAGAGYAAGYTDEAYTAKGATLASSRDEVFQKADVIAMIRAYGNDDGASKDDLGRLREGQAVMAMTDPLGNPQAAKEYADKKVNVFSLELVPRITRAQSMDVLSSQANIAGYKAVLIGGSALAKIFPMMNTAAGTIAPAKVLVMGAGVAGLQAIATAKRLGAVVHAYDVRPEVKEQIESLGGKFVELELDTAEAQGEGGYAGEQSEEFIKKQQELINKVVAESDVVITTAAIPGRKSPILVTTDMVKGMMPGSVIVDLASERGGNCELTKHGETVKEHGVTIIGPANINSTVAYHSSQTFAKNIENLLKDQVAEGKFHYDRENDVTVGCLVTLDGEVVQERVRELLDMEPLAKPAPAEEAAPSADETESKEG